MTNRWNETSPALQKRIAALSTKESPNAPSPLDAGILRMKRIQKAVAAIDAQRIEDMIFHGYDSMEAWTNLLVEHAVSVEEPHLHAMLDYLLKHGAGTTLYTRGLSKRFSSCEKADFYYAAIIRATLLAQAGLTGEPVVNQEVARSLEVFRKLGSYGELADFTVRRGDKLVFRDGAMFPDYYTLKILAFTDTWRSEETLELVATGFRNLLRLQPLPMIYNLMQGQLIAPAWYAMQDFNVPFVKCSDAEKAPWLRQNEFIARMGVLERSDFHQVKQDVTSMYDDPELLRRAVRSIRNPYCFMRWGSYSGLALEDDWRSDTKKCNDVLFRFLLIRQYSLQAHAKQPNAACRDR